MLNCRKTRIPGFNYKLHAPDRISRFLFVLVLGLLLSGCVTMTPALDLDESPPFKDQSRYSEALFGLGRMTTIYNTPEIKIQSEKIYDDTGASAPLATGGEIQRDITEIMKSSLNSIGGKVTFIEYDPAYINNQIATGYSKFENKLIPDVVMTGGITGFDRALNTVSDNKNFAADVQFPNIQNADGNLPPSDFVGLSYTDALKKGEAQISLDFNLKSFETLAGIPLMSTTNSMVVHKALHERELAVSIFGPTFGLKGSNTKVQGRHQAVRILVQLSAVQMVGKYLAVPYWRILGEDAQEDSTVITQIANSYFRMTEFDRLVNVQQWLYLHKFNVDISGEIDEKTKVAIAQFSQAKGLAEGSEISLELFRELYMNVPLDDETYGRRLYLNRLLSQG